ncbi:MAG: septal ring lytic transglycosylase RlpA family protein [Gammaproteobacteria bacterium]|nr:septal ring lytic transglycosylase RlpA family protein [Gammaproteobacteria bacterium]
MQLISLLLLSILLTACSGSRIFEQQDSAPSRHVDVSKIPDAVPRHEARARYGNPSSYEVLGKRYHVMDHAEGYVERGIASWYGTKFHGRLTSSREPYDMYKMTAAHKSLPLPSYVRVTNLDNQRSVVVRVNDRGPFHEGRIIDLSYAAAIKLGINKRGTGRVEVRALQPGVQEKRHSAYKDEVTLTPYTRSGNIYLQVGAFANQENAHRLRSRLQQAAIHNIVIQPVTNSRQQRVYRVKLGPLNSNDAADRLTRHLAELGIHNPHILLE